MCMFRRFPFFDISGNRNTMLKKEETKNGAGIKCGIRHIPIKNFFSERYRNGTADDQLFSLSCFDGINLKAVLTSCFKRIDDLKKIDIRIERNSCEITSLCARGDVNRKRVKVNGKRTCYGCVCAPTLS